MRRRGDQRHPRGGVAQGGDFLGDLVSGKLPALAGLGALGHLGLGEILDGHAEPRAGDLLDGAIERVAIGHRLITSRVFPALAGVAHRPQAIHRQGHRLVGLLADGPVGHRPGAKPLDDCFYRFDLLQGHGRARDEVEQAPQRAKVAGLLVDVAGVAGVGGGVAAAHGLLEVGHRLGIPQVVLAVGAIGIFPAEIQFLFPGRSRPEGIAVAGHRLGGDYVQADASDPRGGALEIVFNHILAQADGLEKLGGVVAAQGRDAHLGHRLEDALLDGADVVVHQRVAVGIARNIPAAAKFLDGFQRQVRVDRVGTEPAQQAKVHNLHGLAGLDDQPGLAAQTAMKQPLMQRRGGQQGRNRRSLGRGVAVRDDQQRRTIGDGGLGGVQQALQARPQSLPRIGGFRVEQGLDSGDLEVRPPRLAKAIQVLVCQDRVRQLEPAAVLGGLLQQVPLLANEAHQRHHQPFP